MSGVVFDPERSVWLAVFDDEVCGIFASVAAAHLALLDLADGAA